MKNDQKIACKNNNNSTKNGTMGIVEPMTRLTKEKSSLTMDRGKKERLVYVTTFNTRKEKRIRFKFRLRVGNITDLFPLGYLLFMVQSVLFCQ